MRAERRDSRRPREKDETNLDFGEALVAGHGAGGGAQPLLDQRLALEAVLARLVLGLHVPDLMHTAGDNTDERASHWMSSGPESNEPTSSSRLREARAGFSDTPIVARATQGGHVRQRAAARNVPVDRFAEAFALRQRFVVNLELQAFHAPRQDQRMRNEKHAKAAGSHRQEDRAAERRRHREGRGISGSGAGIKGKRERGQESRGTDTGNRGQVGEPQADTRTGERNQK